MVISFIMGLIKTTASANSFLKSFFRLSPGFCFADGLASLALLQQDMKDKSSNQAFGWNVTGGSICYLGIESICYFLLTLGLELLLSNKWTLPTLKECWNSIGSIKHGTPSYLESLLKISSDLPYGQGLSLADVLGHLERNRSKLGIAEYSISQSTLETIFNHFAANS
ncbi:hypothetical protein ACFX1W_014302 [Malus domestica]